MNLEELYKLCSEHGSVMLAERDAELIVDWLPNLHCDDKILGEIVFDDILTGEQSPEKISGDFLTVLPYLPTYCRRTPEFVEYYSNELRRWVIEYLNAR